jgi:hypothetical protein
LVLKGGDAGIATGKVQRIRTSSPLFFNAEDIRDAGFRFLYIGMPSHHAGLSQGRDTKRRMYM